MRAPGMHRTWKILLMPLVVTSLLLGTGTSPALSAPGSAKAPESDARSADAALTFIDVPANHKFATEITWMSEQGITTGTKTSAGLAYQPKNATSREAMAAFLFRLLKPSKFTAPKVSPFIDVPTSHKFYREIAWMHAEGISTGVRTAAGPAYQPSALTSREAMAAFLYRIADHKLPLPASAPFTDVPKGHQFYTQIAWMHASGISTGTRTAGGQRYAPKASTSREAMAAFLYRYSRFMADTEKEQTFSAPVPTISGTARVGSTLEVRAGAWKPEPSAIVYQWCRDGKAIPGASKSSYTLAASDAGVSLTVQVTGVRTGYAKLVKTSAAVVIAPGQLTSAKPTISGTAATGETLTAQPGAWSPAGVTLTYQWMRGGAAIVGATKQSYRVGGGDAGTALSVRVSGAKAGYTSMTRTSDAVQAIGRIVAQDPSLYGEASVGGELFVWTGDWIPQDVSFSYQWLRDEVAIPGATGDSYAVTEADMDAEISIRVTGSKQGFDSVSRESWAWLVERAFVSAPDPVIEGMPSVGEMLRAVTGNWDPAPSFQYLWYRDGVIIEDALTAEYELGAADLGARIAVEVIASKPGYTETYRTSAETAPVADAGIVIVDSDIEVDTVWSPDEAEVYVLNRWIRVLPGVTLTVEPGVVVKAAGGSWDDRAALGVAGHLNIQGDADHAVVFTSLEDDSIAGDTGSTGESSGSPGDWQGISIDEGGSATIRGADFRYARVGVDSWSAAEIDIADSRITETSGEGISISDLRYAAEQQPSRIRIVDNLIEETGAVGIGVSATVDSYLEDLVPTVPEVARNTVNRAGDAAVLVHGDALDGSQLRGNSGSGNAVEAIQLSGTLVADTEVPLGVLPLNLGSESGGLTVAPSATLSVAAGEVVKMHPTGWRGYKLAVRGSLVAEGTSDRSVVFTSWYDDEAGGDRNGDGGDTSPAPGDWGTISVEDSGSLRGSYLESRFGQRGIASTEGEGLRTLELDHARVSETEYAGVDVGIGDNGVHQGVTRVSIVDSTVEDVGGVGIDVEVVGHSGFTAAAPEIARNTVTGSRYEAIRVHSDVLDGALLRDNSGADNGIDSGAAGDLMYLSGTVTADLALPLGDLPTGIGATWVNAPDRSEYASLTVGAEAELSVDAGETVPVQANSWTPLAGLRVQGAVIARGEPSAAVVFTSSNDPAAFENGGGDLAEAPAANDWIGVTLEGDGSFTGTYVESRYAAVGFGASEGAGAPTLDLSHARISDTRLAGVNIDRQCYSLNGGAANVRIVDSDINQTEGKGIQVYLPFASSVIPEIARNTISDARDAAISVCGGNLHGEKLSGNTGSWNYTNEMQLSGTLTTDFQTDADELKLGIGSIGVGGTSRLTIGSDATLSVGAGHVIKGSDGFDASLWVQGSLIVEGTAENPAIFTSTHDRFDGEFVSVNAPAAGDWSGISVQPGGSFVGEHFESRYADVGVSSDDGKLDISHARISETTFMGISASSESAETSIRITDSLVESSGQLREGYPGIDVRADEAGRLNGAGQSPEIARNTVNDASGVALLLRGENLDGAKLRDNSGSGNQINAFMMSGTVTSDIDLPLGALPLMIETMGEYWDPGLTVAPAATMTLEAGAVLRAGYRYQNDHSTLSVQGALVANGTAEHPAVFTSYEDAAAGDVYSDAVSPNSRATKWTGIEVVSGGTATLNHADIRFADIGVNVHSGAAVTVNGAFRDNVVSVHSNGTYVDARNSDWGSPEGPAGGQITGSGVDVLPWVGWVTPERPAVAPPQAIPSGGTCATYTVFGLRGSGEAPRAEFYYNGPIITQPQFTGETDGFGDNNQQLFAAFSAHTSGTKKQIAIQYQALPVPIADEGVSINAYIDSIFDGVDKLIQRMNEEEVQCPQTKFVILGYSQGALAGHIALRIIDDPMMMEKIVGVGFVADPGRVVNAQEDWWATGSYVDGQLNMWKSGPNLFGGLWSVPSMITGAGPLPDAVIPRTVALCHEGDIVCAPGIPSSIGRHTDYADGELYALGYALSQRVH